MKSETNQIHVYNVCNLFKIYIKLKKKSRIIYGKDIHTHEKVNEMRNSN